MYRPGGMDILLEYLSIVKPCFTWVARRVFDECGNSEFMAVAVVSRRPGLQEVYMAPIADWNCRTGFSAKFVVMIFISVCSERYFMDMIHIVTNRFIRYGCKTVAMRFTATAADNAAHDLVDMSLASERLRAIIAAAAATVIAAIAAAVIVAIAVTACCSTSLGIVFHYIDIPGGGVFVCIHTARIAASCICTGSVVISCIRIFHFVISFSRLSWVRMFPQDHSIQEMRKGYKYKEKVSVFSGT